MKIFNLDEKYSVVCNSVDTRSGFKHVASLCRNGSSIAETKICYLNRTWERFTYESVLHQLINKFFLEPIVREKYFSVIEKQG